MTSIPRLWVPVTWVWTTNPTTCSWGVTVLESQGSWRPASKHCQQKQSSDGHRYLLLCCLCRYYKATRNSKDIFIHFYHFQAVVPFSACVICPKPGSKEASQMLEAHALYDALNTDVFPDDVIMDDRDKVSVGKKRRDAYRYTH